MRLSLEATDIPSVYTLIDGTWLIPNRIEPLDDYLSGTVASVDTNVIKAAPIADRLQASVHAFGQVGLDGSQSVAVYDRTGLFSAPWVWWLLRSHGVNAALIEGWADTQSNIPTPDKTDFMTTADPATLNATGDEVLLAVDSDVQIIDARPPNRFAGTAAEPRPESRAGHIPGSLNVPFDMLKTGRMFHSQSDLETIFAAKCVDLSRPIITSCGSGVTASGLAFALSRCGASSVKVYQGSWAEWGVDPMYPVETGS